MLQSKQKTNARVNESGSALPIVLGVVLLLIVGAFIVMSNKDVQQDVASVQGESTPNVASTEPAAEKIVDKVVAKITDSAGASDVNLDLEALGTPRILGNPEALVKISEHSSFTCGGCALFHGGNFKNIKKDYIDTGKAYIVFDDFPRNQYDILIGAAARCVPDQSYFNFVQLLFETQKEWLSEDYMTYVKQNAVLAGASKDAVDACVENEDLQKILASRQEAANKNHGVNSTPTLIINDSVKIGGLDTYSNIKKVLDEAYEAADK